MLTTKKTSSGDTTSDNFQLICTSNKHLLLNVLLLSCLSEAKDMLWYIVEKILKALIESLKFSPSVSLPGYLLSEHMNTFLANTIATFLFCWYTSLIDKRCVDITHSSRT